MEITKGDVINSAFSRIRISGVTLNPSGDDDELALDRLESMMAQFEKQYSLSIGYNFTDIPDTGDVTNVPLEYKDLMTTSLAVRTLDDYGKAVPAALGSLASAAFSAATGQVIKERMNEVPYPRRHPRGSGNTLRTYRWNRFYNQSLPAPKTANQLYIGDINDYTEDFTDSLQLGQNISSYTITTDNRLSLVSDSELDGVITYRVEGISTGSLQPEYQQVKIQVTTSSGREITRLIDFEVTEAVTVGGN